MRALLLASATLALAACGAADDPDMDVVDADDAFGEVQADRAADRLATDADTTLAEAEDALDDRRADNARLEELSDDGFCVAAGPQTPRDISNVAGTNPDSFRLAPAASEMNLCNIHTHTNAEHKASGFSVSAGTGDYGGFKCNETEDLTEAELADYDDMDFGKVKPGDTIEVHWVHTSCDIEPGEGLGSCLSDTCTDPLLRVEAQTFLVVNDRDALDFMEFAEVTQRGGYYQAAEIPSGSGTPVMFRGSTTGTSYNDRDVCSPLRVTWNVRPQCQKLDIASLDAWAESDNVFAETESHGVRPLVRDERLLSPIGSSGN